MFPSLSLSLSSCLSIRSQWRESAQKRLPAPGDGKGTNHEGNVLKTPMPGPCAREPGAVGLGSSWGIYSSNRHPGNSGALPGSGGAGLAHAPNSTWCLCFIRFWFVLYYSSHSPFLII